MSNNPLHVVYTENKTQPSRPLLNKKSRREELRAILERKWLQNIEKFDPQRDCIERKRIQTTFDTIQSSIALSQKKAVDMGCGEGTLTRMLRDAGASVDAVDVSSIALKKLSEKGCQGINVIQDCLPTTTLQDKTYDLVICTEVIGYLHPDEYRMAMAELARLVKSDGIVVCSTDLDINTEDPLNRFAALAETEFTIDKWILSYHRLFLRWCNFFEKPMQYVKANNNIEFKETELSKRRGIARSWFKWNSRTIPSYFWRLVSMLSNPISSRLRQSNTTMNFLERMCRFLWSDAGISHATFIGKLRPLSFPVKEDQAPRELKHKRQVWE